MSAYKRILVAVDGSAASNKGLREAIRVAKAESANLCILHVVDDYQAFAGMEGAMAGVDLVPMFREGGKKVLEKAKRTAEAARVRVSTVLRETLGGPAAGPIVREAKKSEQVVRTASVPVLLVRG